MGGSEANEMDTLYVATFTTNVTMNAEESYTAGRGERVYGQGPWPWMRHHAWLRLGSVSTPTSQR
jgi:hypothetical protein